METVLTSFDSLRDFLYVITQINKKISTVIIYKGILWKIWYWDRSNMFQIFQCSETVDTDVIEFDMATGKFRSMNQIRVKPTTVNFVVVRPLYSQILDFVLEQKGGI